MNSPDCSSLTNYDLRRDTGIDFPELQGALSLKCRVFSIVSLSFLSGSGESGAVYIQTASRCAEMKFLKTLTTDRITERPQGCQPRVPCAHLIRGQEPGLPGSEDS